MKVLNISDLAGSDRDVSTDDWRSVRMLVASDGLGYSLHETTVPAGARFSMHYKNHIEANYIIEGIGVVINDETQERHELGPGSLYVLDQHDRHTVEAVTEVRALCVFTPPTTGTEVHDSEGSYPLPGAPDGETGAP